MQNMIEIIKINDVENFKNKLKIYLEKNDINNTDTNGWTLLHWLASQDTDEQIIKCFLNYQPEWKLDHQTNSPLDIAIEKGISEHKRKIFKEYYEHILTPVFMAPKNQKSDICPQSYVRLSKERLPNQTGDRPIAVKKFFADLTHHSKKTELLKSKLNLSQIHHDLRIVVAKMGLQTKGNVASAAISFEIKIDEEGQKPFFVTFPIKIPQKTIFTFSDAADFFDSSQDMRDHLSAIYTQGRNTYIPENSPNKHGHQPKYDGSAGDAQYIHHSEQPLFAYLMTSDAAKMLVRRLVSTLRGDDRVPIDKTIKVYSATVHLHSTKVPCGACEFVIVGSQLTWDVEDSDYGFNKNLSKAFLDIKSPYTFRLSNKRATIDLFCTYSADETDKNHQKKNVEVLASWSDRLPTSIELHNIKRTNNVPETSRKVFVGHFGEALHRNVFSNQEIALSDYSIFSSASDSSGDVTQRKKKYTYAKDADMEFIQRGMQLLHMNDENKPKKIIAKKLNFNTPAPTKNNSKSSQPNYSFENTPFNAFASVLKPSTNLSENQPQIDYIQAAIHGDLDQIKIYLSQGGSITKRDNREFQASALHHAARHKQLTVIKYLLEQGLNPNIKDKSGETPADWVRAYLKDDPIFAEIVMLLETTSNTLSIGPSLGQR